MLLEDVKRVVPAAFVDKKSALRSEKFMHIPTGDIVQKMHDMGYVVTKAQQKVSRVPDKEYYGQYMMRFRQNDVKPVKDDVLPEVVMYNANDATRAFSFYLGLFRCVCNNGLVVGVATMEPVKVRHLDYNSAKIKEAVDQIIERARGIKTGITQLTDTVLTPDMNLAFARDAMTIRYGQDEPFEPGLLLEARRDEDKEPNLWTTFNVVQENLMRGGQHYRTGNRSMQSRPIDRITKGVQYNMKLWDKAVEYAVAA